MAADAASVQGSLSPGGLCAAATAALLLSLGVSGEGPPGAATGVESPLAGGVSLRCCRAPGTVLPRLSGPPLLGRRTEGSPPSAAAVARMEERVRAKETQLPMWACSPPPMFSLSAAVMGPEAAAEDAEAEAAADTAAPPPARGIAFPPSAADVALTSAAASRGVDSLDSLAPFLAGTSTNRLASSPAASATDLDHALGSSPGPFPPSASAPGAAQLPPTLCNPFPVPSSQGDPARTGAEPAAGLGAGKGCSFGPGGFCLRPPGGPH